MRRDDAEERDFASYLNLSFSLIRSGSFRFHYRGKKAAAEKGDCRSIRFFDLSMHF